MLLPEHNNHLFKPPIPLTGASSNLDLTVGLFFVTVNKNFLFTTQKKLFQYKIKRYI